MIGIVVQIPIGTGIATFIPSRISGFPTQYSCTFAADLGRKYLIAIAKCGDFGALVYCLSALNHTWAPLSATPLSPRGRGYVKMGRIWEGVRKN